MNIRSEVLRPRQSLGFDGSVWGDQPASLLLFAVLAAFVAAYCVLIDRTFLIDQQNYIEDFSQRWSLDWFTRYTDGGLLRGLLIAIFSEELLWRVWTALWGSFVNPQIAVLLTVCALNFLVIVSVRRLAGPSLALLLWVLLPWGFAVIGLLQLRQGFAFAVMMFCALRANRLVLGCLIAAMLHTTFVIPLVFAIIARVFRSSPVTALVVAVFVAFAVAYSGGMLFDLLGSRRLQTYSVDEGASSINYVVGGLVSIVPSIYWILTAAREKSQQLLDRVVSSFAVAHVGTTFFTVFSFFIFPLGTARVGYLIVLLLIPVLPSLVARRRSKVALAISCFLFIYLLYLVGKAYTEHTYDVYLGL